MTVPTGAFVVRRKGQVFVTGNSGFPKSLNISKAIDNAAGAQRDVIGEQPLPGQQLQDMSNIDEAGNRWTGRMLGGPVTDAAKQWDGWGTALKPSHEPAILARKPLSTGKCDVVQAVLYHLASNGVESVVWTNASASRVKSPKPSRISIPTRQRKTAEVSAEHASGSETQNTERTTENVSTKRRRSIIQTPSIETSKDLLRANTPKTNADECLNTMVASVPAAESQIMNSSQSTTLMEAEQNIGEPADAKYVDGSSRMDSRLAFDFCVGTATRRSEYTGRALTVTYEGKDYSVVETKRGWVWPSKLPHRLSSQSCTVANNVLKHGTGAINIDACRIAPGDPAWPGPSEMDANAVQRQGTEASINFGGAKPGDVLPMFDERGRWPANIYMTPKAARSEREAGLDVLPAITNAEAVERKPGSKGANNPRAGANREQGKIAGCGGGKTISRCAEHEAAVKSHSNNYTCGCSIKYEGANPRPQQYGSIQDGRPHTDDGYEYDRPSVHNIHPTVKPIKLMRWLVRLLTPPGGTVLEPFAGSGTTLVAAQLEGFKSIGVEKNPPYADLCVARLQWAIKQSEGDDQADDS